MASPNSPYGLPASPAPRATRPNQPRLAPLDTSTSLSSHPPSTYIPRGTSPFSADSSTNEKQHSPYIDTRKRNNDSMIFVNATIPLSPSTESSTSNSFDKERPFDGLAPRKRNGLARLFCCFGREERARRRAARYDEYEEVGVKCHWTEL